MSTTVEKIFEEFRALPPDEQRQLVEMIERETHAAEQARRARVARELRGKYRDVLSSSEEFMARKAVETAEEDRPR